MFYRLIFKGSSTSSRNSFESWHSRGDGHTFFFRHDYQCTYRREFFLLISTISNTISRKSTITILGIKLLHNHLSKIDRYTLKKLSAPTDNVNLLYVAIPRIVCKARNGTLVKNRQLSDLSVTSYFIANIAQNELSTEI